MVRSPLKLLSGATICGVVAASGVPTAEAVVVTITSGANTGEVVFNSNGFEPDAAGSSPASANALGTYQFNNTAGVTVTTGSYTTTEANGPTDAKSGAKYLTIDRDVAGANANSWLTMEFTRDVDIATESFTVAFAQWGTTLGTDGESNGMSVGGDAADGTASATTEILTSWGYNVSVPDFVSFTNSGSVLITDSATSTQKIDSVWNLGAWNDLAYVWDASTQEARLLVNGTSFDLINQMDNPAMIQQFHIRSGSATSEIYIDTIPEPSTLILGAAGSLICLGRRRRAKA